jgi:2-oxoglutarate ferredoxin oxidoreductase subunit beta
VLRIADVDGQDLVVHDAMLEDPSYAFALSRLGHQDLDHTPVGVFRSVRRPAYDDVARGQVAHATAAKVPNLTELLHGKDTWTVAAAHDA